MGVSVMIMFVTWVNNNAERNRIDIWVGRIQ
jgi:hypothetical protein